MIINRDTFYQQRITPRDNRFFAGQHPWVSLVACDLTPLAQQEVPIVLPADSNVLPQALITPTPDDHPFGEHTPRLWQHYPFSLTVHVVGLDAEDSGQLGSVLQGDPQAPHWLDHTGYRLFDEYGQASAFLNKTLAGLRAVRQEVMQTQQWVWLLHQLRVLTPCEVYHAEHTLPVYRIEMDRLMDRMGHSDDDKDLRLATFAADIERSQKEVALFPARKSRLQGVRGVAT